MALRIGGSAESDKYRPIFGQQRPQPSMSIPMGGFMGQNQIGGQSAINIYKAPEPELTPEQRFENRAAQYQQDVAEFNLGQKEAELAKLRAEDEEIASGRFMLNGQAVTRAEMDEYQKNIAQSSKNNSASMVESLRSFQEDPSRFFMGGEQDLGELTNYLGQANQLFRATGQEGNLMDFILGSTPSKQDQMRQYNLKTFQRAAPGIDFPSIGGSQMSVMGFPSGQSIANRPAISSTKQNSAESLSERLSRVGVRPEEQAQIIGALGPSGRGSYVAKEFAPR
tara:strand:+ start:14 stop:856 length:843 start_codon:yes stop_codon:yes gene_type:complete